jgi:hypothetical protein
VQIEEFSPKSEVILGAATATPMGSTTILNVNFTSVQPVPPRVEWTFTQGGGRHLSLVREDTGTGVISVGEFEVPEGSTLVMAEDGKGVFSASINTTDVTAWFSNVGGTVPPQLPNVPAGVSRWIFSANRSAEFDISTFDAGETFDAADFLVKMVWTRYQPLMFDVIIPYFVDAAVRRIVTGSGYENRFKVFKGISLDAIQEVVDDRRAAGVRGMVQYSLTLPGESLEANPWDDQGPAELFSADLENAETETHDAREDLLVGALGTSVESHDSYERFVLGAVFNHSVFDGSFGFQ